MKTIVFFTKKYFYAREITEYLSFHRYQILTFWKSDELFQEMEKNPPGILIVDYAVGNENWVSFFEKLWKQKKKHGFSIIAFWEASEKRLEPNLIDLYLEKPVVLSRLRELLSGSENPVEIRTAQELMPQVRETLAEKSGKMLDEDEFVRTFLAVSTGRTEQAEKLADAPSPIVMTPDSSEKNTDNGKVEKKKEKGSTTPSISEEGEKQINSEKLRELEKISAENHYLRAYIYYMKGSKNAARRECEEALRYDPDNQKAVKLLSHL